MAKKAKSSDRSDPKSNKSLAIRMTLKKMPTAKASEVADAVKREYGHVVPQNMIYMVKTKLSVKKSNKRRRKNTPGAADVAAGPNSAAQWVDAIKYGRQLLQATGSIETATALLKAIQGR